MCYSWHVLKKSIKIEILGERGCHLPLVVDVRKLVISRDVV